jgi:hypothetical protein
LLTPSSTAVKLEKRGFHEKSPAARELLETIGETFLTGYGHAAEARTLEEATGRLEAVPVRFRGFAYEGAAMGFAVRDALFPGGGRFDRFLAGPGDPHVYMAAIGLGWAMARMPKFRWPKSRTVDPLLRWLVLDGYGFHQAYFHTGRYVHQHVQQRPFPWPDGASPAERAYADRAIDQGIGRALWFVGGTDPDLVAALIGGFPEQRRADLYSGAGLAATYAGGADEGELTRFWAHAGEYRPQVAQGAAFAAEARVRAGLLVPHTHVATKVFCGMAPAEAARMTEEARPHGPDPADGPPAYEGWRRHVAAKFASLGGVST